MTPSDSARRIRQALLQSLPPVDQAGSHDERDPAFTYVPPSHAKALDPDCSVVEGIRGAGKSFWWSHLASEPHRRFIEAAFPDLRLPHETLAVQAFGAQATSQDAPSPDLLAKLIQAHPPRAVWRAVLALKAAFPSPFPATAKWPERVAWVAENPEAFDELLLQRDAQLDAQGSTLVVMFDALDRLADDWDGIRPLARGLMQIALEMRSTKRIRCKLFLRPDMLQDKAIIGFPDASKLLARRASLAWRKADLYALLFQCLANAGDGGQVFRDLCAEALGLEWTKASEGWQLPSKLRADEDLQEAAFVLLAGNAMGAGPSGYKRGKPYTWLVNHLQDGLDQVSPRSFAAALIKAVEQTPDEYPLALHFRAIQDGVKAASAIRVDEVTGEDYPWVDIVMKPLKGNIIVPCTQKEIERLWKQDGTVEALVARLAATGPKSVKLPPQNLELKEPGLLIDLAALGLVKRMNDSRIQMPDVYRIAFGLGRKGGVKPLK